MSYVTSYYHFVFCTYKRRMTIPEAYERDLYAYIFGIIKNKNCQLIRIGGTPNHIHLLVNLNAEMAPSRFAQIVKQSSSRWMHQNEKFRHFECWGKEYFAFSKSQEDVATIKNYIANQKQHHCMGRSFDDELKQLMEESGFTTKLIDIVMKRIDGDVQSLRD